MKCFTCKVDMVCVDDVNFEGVRIDFMECPKCKSSADISYDRNMNIKEINWSRDERL